MVRSSLLLSTGRAVSGMARLLVNLGVARLFAEQTGFTAEYQKVWLVFNTTYMLFVFGLPQALYYFHPREQDDEGRRQLLSHVHALLTGLGLVYGLLLWLAAPLAASFYEAPELLLHLRVFALYGFAMVASMSLEAVFNLLGRFRLLAGWLIGEALLFVAVALMPLMGYAGRPLPGSVAGLLPQGFPQESGAIHLAFLALSLLALLRLVLYHGLLWSSFPAMAWSSMRLGLGRMREILGYSLPILATTMVVYLAMYMDKNVVAASFGDSGIYAIFQAGAMEVPFVSVLVGSVTAVMLPRLSRLQHEGRLTEIAQLLAEGTTRLAWLIFPLFTLLFVLADLLYVVFYGPVYEASALPFRIYLLVFPLRLMYYGQVLNTLGMQRWVFWTALGDLALNMSLSLWWVRLFGMAGPAWATAAATFAELAVFGYLLRRGLQTPLRMILPPRELFVTARLALLAGLAALGGRLIGETPGEALGYAIVLHAVVYLGLQLPGGTLKTRWRELITR